jgi:hypothetical protein
MAKTNLGRKVVGLGVKKIINKREIPFINELLDLVLGGGRHDPSVCPPSTPKVQTLRGTRPLPDSRDGSAVARSRPGEKDGPRRSPDGPSSVKCRPPKNEWLSRWGPHWTSTVVRYSEGLRWRLQRRLDGAQALSTTPVTSVWDKVSCRSCRCKGGVLCGRPRYHGCHWKGIDFIVETGNESAILSANPKVWRLNNRLSQECYQLSSINVDEKRKQRIHKSSSDTRITAHEKRSMHT